MKKQLILTVLCLLCGAAVCMADEIVTRSADVIVCKVATVGESTITYRKSGEKFDREIPVSEVFKIKYDNGQEENYANRVTPGAAPGNTAPGQTLTRGHEYAHVETEPDWNSMPPASREYQIGDWYNENGIEGIVVWTTPDGRHGRILHKKKWNNPKFKAPKPFFTGPVNVVLGMNDMTNGYANKLKWRVFMQNNPQYSPDMFPMLQIIESLGGDWYMPAIKELEYFETLSERKVNYTGSNPEFRGKSVKWGKIFDSVSKKHGGQKHNDYHRISSTESYSEALGSVTSEALFGTPCDPQFVVLELIDSKIRPVVRDRPLEPFYAFHLF